MNRRHLAICGACLGLIPVAGCLRPPGKVGNVRVAYRFDHVRSNDDFDEWEHIRTILVDHAADGQVLDREVTGSDRQVGDMTVRQYLADLEVADLDELDAIHVGLERLARKRFSNNERIEFKLLRATADLAYGSNYVHTGLEIVMHGVTDPSSRVTIYLHDGFTAHPSLASDGRWTMKLKVAPGRRYIYGFAVGKDNDVKKYFRIDIFTQLQQDVGASEFDSLRKREP